MWAVVFYETDSGKIPVKRFIDSLSEFERARVVRDLKQLEAFGLELKAPLVRGLRKKLWELRITGSNQHRILYFAVSGRRLVLLHGFTKKTQRTPPTEIEKALKRMADYLARGNEDGR